MRKIRHDEIHLFLSIKSIRDSVEILENSKTNEKTSTNKKRELSKADTEELIFLVNQVNDYTPIGDVETLNDICENKRFTDWYVEVSDHCLKKHLDIFDL